MGLVYLQTFKHKKEPYLWLDIPAQWSGFLSLLNNPMDAALSQERPLKLITTNEKHNTA